MRAVDRPFGRGPVLPDRVAGPSTLVIDGGRIAELTSSARHQPAPFTSISRTRHSGATYEQGLAGIEAGARPVSRGQARNPVDLAVLDRSLHVVQTYVGGALAFSAPSCRLPASS